MGKIFLSMLLSIGIVLLLPTLTKDNYIEAHAPVRMVKDYSVTELIAHFAKEYNQDPKLLTKIAYCESKLKPNLVGDKGLALGVFQIHKGTFNGWAKQMGETLNYKSPYDQIKVAAWSFSQGEQYRRSWTTYRAYKNGGVYSFYSRTLQGHYTVRCK